MPPSVDQIKGGIEKALLASTDPVFREKDSSGVPTNDLPDNLKVIVKSIAQGVYDSLKQWQSQQVTVTGTCPSGGGPLVDGAIKDTNP